jgi:hypothetical protein
MHSGTTQSGLDAAAGLDASIASATQALLGYRQPDGHWVFELEADSTIPAEYVLLDITSVSRRRRAGRQDRQLSAPAGRPWRLAAGA